MIARTPRASAKADTMAAPQSITGVILLPMKTAISIPDEIFEGAERTASELGMSRSELYATAVREFVERYRNTNVTARLDEVYAQDDSSSLLDARLEALQAYSLRREDWR